MSELTIAFNVILTLLYFGLIGGYPGYPMMLYSWGLETFDTDAARNDAFDLSMSMGAALGIPQITLVDHFNIASAALFPLAWISSSHKLQAMVGGAALLSGMYMFLFVAVFVPARMYKDVPDVLIISVLMSLSGLHRMRILPKHLATILKRWAILVGTLAVLALVVSSQRVPLLKATLQLRKECVGVPGAYDKVWPSGWDFEPLPFGSTTSGWPSSPKWPEGTGCTPDSTLIEASRNELNQLNFLPLWMVLGTLMFLVSSFVLSVLLVNDDKEKRS